MEWSPLYLPSVKPPHDRGSVVVSLRRLNRVLEVNEVIRTGMGAMTGKQGIWPSATREA